MSDEKGEKPVNYHEKRHARTRGDAERTARRMGMDTRGVDEHATAAAAIEAMQIADRLGNEGDYRGAQDALAAFLRDSAYRLPDGVEATEADVKVNVDGVDYPVSFTGEMNQKRHWVAQGGYYPRRGIPGDQYVIEGQDERGRYTCYADVNLVAEKLGAIMAQVFAEKGIEGINEVEAIAKEEVGYGWRHGNEKLRAINEGFEQLMDDYDHCYWSSTDSHSCGLLTEDVIDMASTFRAIAKAQEEVQERKGTIADIVDGGPQRRGREPGMD